MEETKELTPEQQKVISFIIRKARLTSLSILLRFWCGFFVLNTITTFAGMKLLKDTDTSMQTGFHFVSTLINVVFMMTYLSSRLKKNSDIVIDSVKEVLNK